MYTLYILIITLIIINCSRGDSCNSTICKCGQPIHEQNTDFVKEIPNLIDTKIILRFMQKTCSYQIDCRNNLDYMNYISESNTNLELGLFKLLNCTLQENVRVKDLMNLLGIKTTSEVQLTRSTLNINSDTFTGLDNLKKLTINQNKIKINIPHDLLYNLNNLLMLNMNFNNITIPQDFFIKSNLTQLLISENYLPDNTTGIFNNLINIERLEMFDMNIKTLPEDIFQNLTKLNILELSVNQIESLPENIFKDLHNLKEIGLGKNKISSIHENVFKYNKKLTRIKLAQSFDQNITIPEKLFWSLQNLNNLDLSYNHLTILPNYLFSNLTMLKTLYLNHNKLTTLPKDIFKNLDQLTELNIQNNLLQILPFGLFSNLNNLESLYLSSNRIKIFDKIFYGLYNLKTLDLGYNNLTFEEDYSQSQSAIKNLQTLEKLILHHNNISELFYDWRILFLQLKFLDLSYNNFTELKDIDFELLQTDLKIIFAYNKITDISMDLSRIFDTKTKKNIIIDINNNPIHCGCNLYNLYEYYNKIKRPDTTVNYTFQSDNLICQTPVNMYGTYVKNINSENFNCSLSDEYDVCPKNSSCYFKPFTNTLIIDGTSKKYTTPPELNIKTIPKIYDTSTSNINIILNISGNSLKNFPKQNNSYENVTMLDLSNNNIESIEWLPNDLQFLYLHNNNISILNSTQLKLFNTKKIKNMTLYDNPWNCNCELIDFMNYLQENYHKVIIPSGIKCAETNEVLLKLSKDDLCPSRKNLIISLSIIIALLSILTAVTIGLFYHYNMEIKVWLYAHHIFLWFITEEELDKDKIYDAFISYSHKDEDFIINEILPKLEDGEKPYKICLHFRNWQPGEFITTNITRSINESRRTIVILSSNFLESEWGKMEFKTAHVQALSEGRARVIVILLGEIPMDDLDEELKAYLNTNTYVKWGDPWFWDKLRYALPHNIKKDNLPLDIVRTSDRTDLINNSNIEESTPPIDKINTDPTVIFNNIGNRNLGFTE